MNQTSSFLPAEDSYYFYLTRVVRIKAGEEFVILDGHGGYSRAKVGAISKKGIVFEICEPFTRENPSIRKISLYQSYLKGKKMDIIIEKATELGVDEIIPLFTDRSIPKEQNSKEKIRRWNEKIKAVCRQIKRLSPPVLVYPITFEMLSCQGFSSHKDIIVCYEKGGIILPENLAAMLSHSTHIHLFSGPEGGFSDRELDFFNQQSAVFLKLPFGVLKAETATITALGIISFFLKTRA